MITDVNSLSGYQFEWARWLPQGDNAHFGAHYIRVARQGDKQRSFATAGGNIVTFSRRITLFTLYKCMANCKINDHVEYEGNRYFVAGITENIPNSPQSLGILKPKFYKAYQMELVQLDEAGQGEN